MTEKLNLFENVPNALAIFSTLSNPELSQKLKIIKGKGPSTWGIIESIFSSQRSEVIFTVYFDAPKYRMQEIPMKANGIYDSGGAILIPGIIRPIPEHKGKLGFHDYYAFVEYWMETRTGSIFLTKKFCEFKK